MTESVLHKYFTGLSKNTLLLACASLFADISTEMLYPVLPVYLTETLRANGSIVGIVEGAAQATQNIVQGVSGWASDKLQQRKPIALVGYALAAFAKPLIGLTNIWQGVLGARFLDRLGTGVRSAPRDALIAASAQEESRGKAFGLEGIGDNAGAFLGPLLAVLLLFALHIEMRSIFFLALIPGLLAVIMIALIKEKPVETSAKSKLDVNLRQFPRAYWKYLTVIALFGIGNSSNSFLILQTKSLGISLEATVLIYAFFNLIAALISYPSGYFSDKLGRKFILLVAFIIFLITYLGFALLTNIYLIAVLFIFYGLFQGIFRSVGKAFASDFVPQPLRASAVGWYSTTVGLTGLIASIVAGQLWDRIGHPAVFLYGAIFAIVGSATLLAVIPQQTDRKG
jgi:MFS family permease